VLYFLGVVEIPLIFGGALLVLLVRIAQRRRSGEEAAASVPFGLPLGLLAAPRGSRGDGRCGRHLPLVSEDRFGALRASAAFVLSPAVSQPLLESGRVAGACDLAVGDDQVL
jgi:hypothetical protein